MIDPIYAARIDALEAELLKAPDVFDMAFWMNSKDEEFRQNAQKMYDTAPDMGLERLAACGTTCCLAGAMHVMWPHLRGPATPLFFSRHLNALAEFFGVPQHIPGHLRADLFYETYWPAEYRHRYEQAANGEERVKVAIELLRSWASLDNNSATCPACQVGEHDHPAFTDAPCDCACHGKAASDVTPS